MKRKIIKQGHNTLTVTLPSEWTKKFNLGGGKEVEVIERDNGLFITTEKISGNKKIEIDITNMEIPLIWKYLMAVYREGYDEVKIKFSSNLTLENPYKFMTSHRVDMKYYKKHSSKCSTFETLQGFVNRFIGFEIVEHGEDFVVIKEMGDLTSREFDNSLRRVLLFIQQMAEDTLKAIEIGNPKIIENMHDVDINLDKFHDYCIRIMNKIANKDSRKTPLLFATLYLLELAGDEFKNISQHLVSYEDKFNFKNIEPLARSVKEQIDIYYDLFYKFAKEKIEKIAEIDKAMYNSVPQMYKKSNEDEKEIYHHLRIIERYINALLELRIEMEY